MIFRYARHTSDIKRLRKFYTELIGLAILSEFGGHDGYNGLILGETNGSWQLELTDSPDKPDQVFDPDDCIVFYPETRDKFDAIIGRMRNSGIPETTPRNSYWKENGIMFLDPDGYRVVISNVFITT